MKRSEATIIKADRGGAFVTAPGDVVVALGEGGRIPVRATFDGVAYQEWVVSMGAQLVIGLLKAVRGQLGKWRGDVVTVTLAVDAGQPTGARPRRPGRRPGRGRPVRPVRRGQLHAPARIRHLGRRGQEAADATRIGQTVERPPG
jgi:hypothetical protein